MVKAVELPSDVNEMLRAITKDHKHLYRLQPWSFVSNSHMWMCNCWNYVYIGKILWQKRYVGNDWTDLDQVPNRLI